MRLAAPVRPACRVELQLDFMEAVFGTSRELEVDRLVACEVRRGAQPQALRSRTTS